MNDVGKLDLDDFFTVFDYNYSKFRTSMTLQSNREKKCWLAIGVATSVEDVADQAVKEQWPNEWLAERFPLEQWLTKHSVGSRKARLLEKKGLLDKRLSAKMMKNSVTIGVHFVNLDLL